MLAGTLLALRDHARVRAIGAVIARYGMGDVMHRLGLSELLPGSKTALPSEMPERSAPERLRRALEELGPTFIKLGQILATRNDLLPLEWTQELEKLQGHAAPVPWESIRSELESALGQTVEQAFARFDDPGAGLGLYGSGVSSLSTGRHRGGGESTAARPGTIDPGGFAFAQADCPSGTTTRLAT